MTEAAVDVLLPVAPAAAASTRPRWLRRLLGNRAVVAGAFILLVFIAAALLAGVLTSYNPTRLSPASRLKRSPNHPSGVRGARSNRKRKMSARPLCFWASIQAQVE